MGLKEEVKAYLQDGPKTVEEIAEHIGKTRGHATTIVSNNPDLFVRIKTGIVDLKEKHPDTEHKVRPGKRSLPLHLEIFNLLAMGPLTNEDLYHALPYESQRAIRATISLKPELFVRIRPGLIGRKGRDDNYKESEKIGN